MCFLAQGMEENLEVLHLCPSLPPWALSLFQDAISQCPQGFTGNWGQPWEWARGFLQILGVKRAGFVPTSANEVNGPRMLQGACCRDWSKIHVPCSPCYFSNHLQQTVPMNTVPLLTPLTAKRGTHTWPAACSGMNLSDSFSFVSVICFLDQLTAPSQESFQEPGEMLARIINQSSMKIYELSSP